MPTIAIVDGILIFNDHTAAHFHAQDADFHARIRIEDGELIESSGRISARHRRRLREWAPGSSPRVDGELEWHESWQGPKEIGLDGSTFNCACDASARFYRFSRVDEQRTASSTFDPK